LIGNHFGCSRNLFSRQTAPDNGQNISIFALLIYPIFVVIVGDGGKPDVHSEFAGLKEQLFHHIARLFIVDTNEHSERQRTVNIGLSEI